MKIKAQKICILSLMLALFVVGSLASVHALDHLKPHEAHASQQSSWLNQHLHGDHDDDAEHCGLWLSSVLAGNDPQAPAKLHVMAESFEPRLPVFPPQSVTLWLRPPSRAPPAIS